MGGHWGRDYAASKGSQEELSYTGEAGHSSKGHTGGETGTGLQHAVIMLLLILNV